MDAQISAFKGPNHVFSNFHGCRIRATCNRLDSQVLEFPSSEHAYQYIKCQEHEFWEEARYILASGCSAAEAKSVAKKATSSRWEESCRVPALMAVVALKWEQVPRFADALQSAAPVILEAVPGDLFWSCGRGLDAIDFNLVGYPGANWFGRVLMALRDRQVKELSVRWGQVTGPIPDIFIQRAAVLHAKWRPDGSVAEPWGQVGAVSVLDDLTVHLGPSGDVPGTDAHFHPDMIVKRLGPGTSVDHLLGGGQNLRLLLASLCFPSSFTAVGVVQLCVEDPRIHLAVGLHPRCLTADKAENAKLYGNFKSFLASHEARALGEVGLDVSRGRDTLGEQIFYLRLMAQIAAAQGLPMVIHCRGDGETPDVEVICIDTLVNVLPDDHPVYLHCVTGAESVKRWRGSFRNMYFGVNGKISTEKQGSGRPVKGAVEIMHPDQLLLESDAPFLHPQGNKTVNFPSVVFEVAKEVAGCTGLFTDQVVESCYRNLHRFLNGCLEGHGSCSRGSELTTVV